MQIHNEKEKIIRNEGINHLTSENSMLDILLEAQKHDELLQSFQIRFVDKSFATNCSMRNKNVIYIVRQDSVLVDRNYDSQVFDATLEIYITLKEYDTIMAQKIMKTMYKDIMYHFANSEIIDYLEVVSFHYEYEEPGVLSMGVITFKSVELENFCFEYDPEPIKVALGLKTSIEGTNEKKLKFKNKIIYKE